jgi:putative phosphoesterase
MRIAVLSDIHGNLFAFSKCLELLLDMNVDDVYFLGDAVNYYPESNEVVNIIRKLKFNCIKGNHEEMLLNPDAIVGKSRDVYGIDHTLRELSEENRDFISSLPNSYERIIDDVKMLFVHGSPLDYTNGYIYPDTDISEIENIDYDVVFCGHSHYKMERTMKNLKVFNPGSCGMPRDTGNEFSFGVFDTKTGKFKIQKFNIDPKEITEVYKGMLHDSVIKLLYRKN